MTSDHGFDFDFDAMKAQGNAVDLPPLYVLTMTPLPMASESQPGPDGRTPLEIHYEYMHRMLEQGKLLLIGPCIGEPMTPGNAPVPPGFGILNVASLEEAEEIARNEPFHAMGWRRNTVTSWTPKFGSLVDILHQHLHQDR